MSHFIARNIKYPQFSFAVKELRPLLNERGLHQTSTLVRFENSLLDTKAQGWKEREAAVIREKLERMYDATVTLRFNDDQQEKQIAVEVNNTAPAIELKGRKEHGR